MAFCVIQIADELTEGAQGRDKQLPLMTGDLQSWRQVPRMCFLIVCLFYCRHAAIPHRRDCQNRHHLYCYHDTF